MAHSIIYNGETITRNGRDYKVTFDHDNDMCAPWVEYDGCGVITEHKGSRNWHGYEKRAGEIIMHEERGYLWVYDWQATMQKAKDEGWGCDIEKLTKKIGHAPTKGEILRDAVERDYQFCRGYLLGYWYYVVICVEDTETGECDYLGGVESSDSEYLSECALGLIDNREHARQRAHDGKFSAVMAMGV